MNNNVDSDLQAALALPASLLQDEMGLKTALQAPMQEHLRQDHKKTIVVVS